METFSQVPLEILLDRADKGLESIHELHHLIKHRYEMEENAISFLANTLKTNIYQNEIIGGSIENVFEKLKYFQVYQYKFSTQFHKEMSENVLSRIQSVQQDFEDRLNNLKNEMKQTNKRYMTALENLEKAKKAFNLSKASFERSKLKYLLIEDTVKEFIKSNEIKKKEKIKETSQPQQRSLFSVRKIISSTLSSAFEANPELERDRLKEQCIKRYQYMITCYDNVKQQKKLFAQQFRDHEIMTDALSVAIDEMERTRINHVQTCLSIYCTLERQLLEKKLNNLETLEKAVCAVNSRTDRDLLLSTSKRPELTHKYSTAIHLLDWDFHRRLNHLSDYEHSRSIRSFESYVDNSSWSEISLYIDLPELPFSSSSSSLPSSSVDMLNDHTLEIEDGLDNNVMNGVIMVDDRSLSEDIPIHSPAFLSRESSDQSVISSSFESQSAGLSDILGLNRLHDDYFISHPTTGIENDSRSASQSVSLSRQHSQNQSSVSSQLSLSQMYAYLVTNPSREDGHSVNSNNHEEATLRDFHSSDKPDSTELRTFSNSYSNQVELSNVSKERNSDNFKSLIGPIEDRTVSTLSSKLPRKSDSESLQYMKKLINIIFPAPIKDNSISSIPHDNTFSDPTSMSQSLVYDIVEAVINTTPIDMNENVSGSVPGEPKSLLSPTDNKTCETDDALPISLILSDKSTRDYFLQQLDEHRGLHATLSDSSYHLLMQAMLACLDHCCYIDDVKTAMRIANMANTFHTYDFSSEGSSKSSSGKIHSSEEVSNDDRPKLRRYIQQETALRDHVIWREEGFWDACLLTGLASELDRSSPIVWDELNPEALSEAVLGVHNVLFGQLGALAFNMKEVGLTKDEVERKVLRLSRASQLGEDQEIALLMNISFLFDGDNVEQDNQHKSS